MKKEIINSKIACDKTGKRIGKIKEIKRHKKSTPEKQLMQIVVLKRFLLEKTLTVSFDQDMVLKTENGKLWLNITKADYNEFINKLVAQRKHMVKSAKFAEASGITRAVSFAYTWGKI